MAESTSSEGTTSPTPTLRNVAAGSAPEGSGRGRPTAGSRQASQKDLGMGRPGSSLQPEVVRITIVYSLSGSGLTSQHRPAPVQTDTTPNRLHPNRAESQASTDDEDPAYSPSIRPHTALPGRLTAESSQRRNLPATAFGSTFGTPHLYHNQSVSGGSATRPARAPRSNSVQPGGSVSRSASRARPPLPTHASFRGKGADGDDEEDEDRGQALIRERQKERKQLRKAKERERERRLAGTDGSISEPSGPPTGIPEEENSLAAQQRAPSRSVSRVRTPSVNRDSRHNHEYFNPRSGAATPAHFSPRDERPPPSLYSENEEEEESVIEDAIHSVLGDGTEGDSADEDDSGSGEGDEGVTLRDRQDAINIEHPFGLPIWKPALYRKSRTITRNAESALHSIPSAAAERHLLPGNIAWVILFGWWLTIIFFIIAMMVSFAEVLGGGRGGYGKTLRGLAWYIGWPFGKYVEGEGAPDDSGESGDDDESGYGAADDSHRGAESEVTVRGVRRGSLSGDENGHIATETGPSAHRREPTVSFAAAVKGKARALGEIHEEDEQAPLLKKTPGFRRPRNKRAKRLGRIVYWPLFCLVVAPVMLFVCLICWGCVITIPMAKLNWALLNLLALRPMEINFRAAPKVPVSLPSEDGEESGDTTLADGASNSTTMRPARLTAGQVAPTAGPTSTVLLCTYRAIGLQYYKYTIGGVNILFINLVPLVFFTIIDGMVLLPIAERAEGHVSPIFKAITSQALIFILGLASVIPLSYFIGMAVASISAQSSIGMGAVINATFGSIIEIILYSIALTEGKGRLVEGSIVGSILAGVLLMPGASMCSGAFKRKEQKFNAKSAGVTSTMLIMAIIGTLTPSFFYQIYGGFELRCEGCPTDSTPSPQDAWKCNRCYYEHPDPTTDDFYQDQVKTLMYACAAILLFSYLIGLWFSLRTHAAQIWQNPQQLMQEHPSGAVHPSIRQAAIQRVTPAHLQQVLPLHKDHKDRERGGSAPPSPVTKHFPLLGTRQSSSGLPHGLRSASRASRPPSVIDEEGTTQPPTARLSSETYNLPVGYTPVLESVDHNLKQASLSPMRLPASITTEDFTRAVAVATVSALRHQGSIIGSHHGSLRKERAAAHHHKEEEEGEGGGHEAPSWTRGFSAGVLLACTLLYALIAEILVDVVDVVLQGSGIDEKFLGLTLFALVPNTTEFMNAMSFAMTGNIALSMEIGSAYALQVCLLQIPAMVAFSALYDPHMMGEMVDTFTIIFPRWDVISIILAIFLLTYTYIEARSNYHRGSILVLAYVVLILGFYYAPVQMRNGQIEPALTNFGAVTAHDFASAMTKLWA